MSLTEETTAFERDTLYRMAVEAARYWVVNHYLHKLRVPDEPATMFVYPSGPCAAMDWGNPPGTNNPDAVLRGKRVRVTLTIEDNNAMPTE